MKIVIDPESGTMQLGGSSSPLSLYSDEAFQLLTEQWLRVGWSLKYSYSFTWLGRPVIQLPVDMVRIQELIWQLRPDVIIETGVAHGGSLVYYASLCKLMGSGRVIGVDRMIRAENRDAIESHTLSPYITLIQGNSVEEDTLTAVVKSIHKDDKVMIVLDSNHTRQHVLAELNAYSQLVTLGSYIVVTDGVMKTLTSVPGSESSWIADNPLDAIIEFLAEHPEYEQIEPHREFNESQTKAKVTYWPGGYLKRIS